MIWNIVKGLFSSVLGNQASLWVFGALFVWAGVAGYNWLDSHDAEVAARTNAVHIKSELERAEQARDIYMDSYDKARANQLKDEKAIVELQTFKATQGALINEALKELDKVKGGDCIIASNRQRVLAITLQRLKATADLSDESDGTAPGRAVTRLRDLFLRKPNGDAAVR